MREQLADAKRRGQRDRARMYADKVAELEAEQSRADALAAFDGDPFIKNAIEGRDALARSGKTIYEGANPADVDLVVALVDRRRDFPSVDAFKAAYSEAMDKVVTDNLNHHRRKSADANVTAAKAESDAANSALALKEAEIRAQGDTDAK